MTPGIPLERKNPVANYAVEDFLRQNRHDVHKRNVSNSKTKVNNQWTLREEERVAASRRNAKREQLDGERYNKIEKDNLKLLVRMQEIETRGPAKAAAMLSLGTAGVRSSSSLPPPGTGSKFGARCRESKRIDFENQRMLKKLQSAKSSVDFKKNEAAFSKQQRIMRMRMENPNEERLHEVTQANKRLLPPRMPTPDPTHDDECDRLIQLRNKMLVRAGLDIPTDNDSECEADLRRSRSCDVAALASSSRRGSRPGSRSGSREGSRPGTARSHASEEPLPAIYSAGTAGIISEKSKAITEALMAEHAREAARHEDAEEEAEKAKEAAMRAFREATAIDVSSFDVAESQANDFLSYGNIIQRGQAALGAFEG